MGIGNVSGFAPNYYFSEDTAGLAVFISSGVIGGKLILGQVFKVPANSTTNISIDANGNFHSYFDDNFYPIATVVSGQVITSGTKTGGAIFSDGIISITVPSKLVFLELVSDPLDGANVSPLPNPPWTTVTSTGLAGLQILNHEAVADSGLSGCSSYTGITWPNDQWASVNIDFLAIDLNEVPTVALNLRCQNTDQQFPYYQLATGRPSSGTIHIYLSKATVDGEIIGEVLIPYVASASLLFAVLGSTLYVYYNSVLAFKVTDSEISSGSFMSLEILADQAVTDAQASNFKAGIVVQR